MTHTLPVIVYGGGDMFVHYFNIIATALGTDTFITLRNLTALLAGVTALVSAISKRDFLVCVRWFALYYLAFYILAVPTVTVRIIDRTTPLYNKDINNVPLGLGILAHTTTVAGDALTQLMDKLCSAPNETRYSKTGMLMASKLMLATRQLQITDSILAENMRQFVTHCVFWDILLNQYTLDDLLDSKNVWEFVKDHASPARACLYTNKDENGKRKTQVTVCNKVVAALGTALSLNINNNVPAYYASKIFPEIRDPIKARNLLMTYLPISHEYLLKSSDTAVNILQQSIMANAIIDGGLQFGIGANSQTAVAAYTNAKAQEQQRLTQNTVAFQAAYWLSITKSVFEAIMYGCFIFVLLLCFFPIGTQVLKNYVLTLCWLQSWSPLYAIINVVCSHYAMINSMGMAKNGFVLRDLSSLMQVNHDMASLAGYLTMSVPFIALGLVKGMASTMTHVAQYLGGVTQSTASQAASEAVAGNISMGITGMRNHTSFNNSSYQQDLRSRMSSGMSYQLPGGESINIMPDGSFAVDRGGTISELGVDINLAKSIHNSAMRQADDSYNTAKSESIAAGEHYAAGMRDLYSLSEHVGKNRNSSESWAYSESGSTLNSLNKIKELTHDFAEQHDISYAHAKDILSRVNAGIGFEAGGSISTSGKDMLGAVGSMGGKVNVGIDGNVQDVDRFNEQKLYKEAEQFVQRTGYSEHIETATKAIHDHNFHSNNEKGARLLEQAEGHFERSQSLRNEATTNFQKAQGYRELASHAEENAVNINVKANNDFLKEISSERSVDGKPRGIITAVADLRDPEMARIMADNYARNWANRHLADWNKGMSGHMPSSVHDIHQSYQDNKKSFNKEINQDLLHERYRVNKDYVTELAKQKDLAPEGSVDESLRNKVEGNIGKHKEEIQQTKEHIGATEKAKEQKIKEESLVAKQNREHGVMYTTGKTIVGKILGAKKPIEEIKDEIGEK